MDKNIRKYMIVEFKLKEVFEVTMISLDSNLWGKCSASFLNDSDDLTDTIHYNR